MMKKIIDKKFLERAMSYEDYRKHVDDLLLQEKSTGQNQSDQITEYSKLNVARMKRIDKTIEILPEAKQAIEAIEQPQTWLVLTEGWCGDAAQIVPVINALSKLNNKIELKLLLRDENLELMDQYLTNGKSRSIPKLIVVNKATMEELYSWGARPKILQDKIDEMKSDNVEFEKIKEVLHGWYAKDKTFSTQQEIAKLVSE